MSNYCNICKDTNNLFPCKHCHVFWCATCAKLKPAEVLILQNPQSTLKFLCGFCIKELSEIPTFQHRVRLANQKTQELIAALNTTRYIIAQFIEERKVAGTTMCYVESRIKGLENMLKSVQTQIQAGIEYRDFLMKMKVDLSSKIAACEDQKGREELNELKNAIAQLTEEIAKTEKEQVCLSKEQGFLNEFIKYLTPKLP